MYLRTILLSVPILLCPLTAFAVLPPDIIFTIGTQLWQIVVGVGALVVGSITALFPFLKSASVNMPRKRVVILSIGLSLAFVGFIYLIFISATGSKIPRLVSTQTASSTGYEFHGNRFVFLGTKSNGERILINLEINRKELPNGGFVHYYMGDVMNGASSTPIYFERTDASREVLSDLFFSQFKRTLPLDHSARESYVITFTTPGSIFSIETEMITSDFLIKNEPEYTVYIGVGRAVGVVDGESVPLHAMIERAYSNDYRTTVFFDPNELIPTETVQLVLWDELGNFSLLDSSRVDALSPAYASHFWGLQKSFEGSAKRVFDGNAFMRMLGDRNEFSAHFSSGGRAHTIDVILTKPFLKKTEEGYIEGVLFDGEKKRSVHGLGYHHLYGPH